MMLFVPLFGLFLLNIAVFAISLAPWSSGNGDITPLILVYLCTVSLELFYCTFYLKTKLDKLEKKIDCLTDKES